MAGVFLVLLLTVLLMVAVAGQAFAGKSSPGKLLFFPCDKCHPLGAERPNGFAGHKIKLEGHDQLGQGKAACFVCHQSVDNPGLLLLADGSTVGVDQDTSKVCYRCHSAKYKAWKNGLHGKQPGCTAKGCHNPHSPTWIAVSPLQPFLGTTREVKAVGSDRTPFEALPVPPEQSPAEGSPLVVSLGLMMVVGFVASLGGSIYLAKSASKERK